MPSLASYTRGPESCRSLLAPHRPRTQCNSNGNTPFAVSQSGRLRSLHTHCIGLLSMDRRGVQALPHYFIVSPFGRGDEAENLSLRILPLAGRSLSFLAVIADDRRGLDNVLTRLLAGRADDQVLSVLNAHVFDGHRHTKRLLCDRADECSASVLARS